MNKTILIGCLIGVLFMFGCTTEQVCEVCEEPEPCPTMFDKALIDFDFGTWGEDIDDSTQAIFSNMIYNYGDVEAKGLILTCEISDTAENSLLKEDKEIGNVGSRSYIYKEVYLDITNIKLDDDANGFCYVSDCDDCEILPLRIKEFADSLQ